MKNTFLSLALTVVLSACNITPQQGLQGLQAVGSLIIDDNYIQQSKRLCAQQNDPASRIQCEQQAHKEFHKFQNEQRTINYD